MKNLVQVTSAITLLAFTGAHAADSAATAETLHKSPHPNIVVILADDI